MGAYREKYKRNHNLRKWINKIQVIHLLIDWNVTVFILGAGSVPDTVGTDSRFDSTTRLRFSLLWHISVMKQDSYASLFQLGGKDFTAQLQVWKCALIQPLINPGLFWACGSRPWDNHTSMKSNRHWRTCETRANIHVPSPATLTLSNVTCGLRTWQTIWL